MGRYTHIEKSMADLGPNLARLEGNFKCPEVIHHARGNLAPPMTSFPKYDGGEVVRSSDS